MIIMRRLSSAGRATHS